MLTEHIGDVLAFSPFAEYLKKQAPDSYTIWLINPRYNEVLQYNPYIDKVYAVQCDGVVEKIKNIKGVTLYDVRFNDNNFCPLCPSKKMAQKIDTNFNLENYYNYGSLLEIFSSFTPYPLKAAEWQPVLQIPQKTLDQVADFLKESYIVIHPESNERAREWQDEKWEKLIEILLEGTHFHIVIIGLKPRLQTKNSRLHDYSGQLTLLQSAALIQKSDYFIGIDSAMAHMANALSIQSTVILGKFRQMNKYMPYSGFFTKASAANIIFDPQIPCHDVPVTTVVEALKKHKILHG